MRSAERLGRVQFPSTEKNEKILTDKIMLRLAHIAIVLLLTMLGFLMTSYVGKLDKAIERITQTQEQMAIMLARVDENITHTERRLQRLENQKP